MIFDSDAHVEESEETFARLHEEPRFSDSAPRVIPGSRRASWLIDGKIFPKTTGKGVFTFGSPHLRSGDGFDPDRLVRIDSQELTDPAARLADMDREGISVSVVFPTVFLVYPLADSQSLHTEICRAYNNWIAQKCERTGGRIRWVAVAPLPHIDNSVEEVRRAKSLGACGVLVMGTVGEMLLGDRRLDPFYAAVEQLELPLCVHVGWSFPAMTNLYDGIYESIVTPFVLPVFMGFTSILCGGVLDRFPRLKVGFFEAGVEWVPYWLDRLDRFYRQPPGGSRKEDLPERAPSQYVREGRVYFSCELDENRIGQTAEVVGDDCILYASDLPHAHRVMDAITLFRQRSDISNRIRTKILEENGPRFFGI